MGISGVQDHCALHFHTLERVWTHGAALGTGNRRLWTASARDDSDMIDLNLLRVGEPAVASCR